MRGVVLAAALLLATACGLRDPAASPEGAVRAFVRHARAGENAAVYSLLGPRTRKRLEEAAANVGSAGGPRPVRPDELLAVGWAPPAWEPATIRVARRDGERAEVEVKSLAGDRQIVETVREEGRYRIELPLR